LDLTKLNRNRVVETLVQKDEDAAGLGLKAASRRRASREEPRAGKHGDVHLQRFGSVGAVCIGLRATSMGKRRSLADTCAHGRGFQAELGGE
jgi:hypothetical protein